MLAERGGVAPLADWGLRLKLRARLADQTSGRRRKRITWEEEWKDKSIVHDFRWDTSSRTARSVDNGRTPETAATLAPPNPSIRRDGWLQTSQQAIMARAALLHVSMAISPTKCSGNGDKSAENSRVLILGGTGRVGGSTATALSKLCPSVQLLIAGRNRYANLLTR
ncbi:hypothetical protein BHE74_00036351 [Ensete ventricosum]|uniref:Saccharopine dehydrogenase NADP binding domain-containing protein n=1 Tax=Ensete ventricosum TaxID=4639 RepID=A0A426YVE5_ENSVE|nr:hypothetical protein B296_00048256 [Ensete ventricosum]RWW56892.1 hypothetical protein BHE74_00036351 [Ensete ventricosum]